MTTPEKSDSTTVVKADLVTLTIDGIEVSVPPNTLVIRAAEQIGVQIPRFCDHPLLDPVGACRQCLVDVPDAGNGRGFPKPQASCTLTVAPGMVVNTQATSPVAEKAQHGVMELLLINHPLDCPVCDKGGECPLQNQAMSNGRGESRFAAEGGTVKRTYPKPINISAQVLLDRERCVLCARCTRFSQQVAGDPFIALIERGALQQVGIYEREPFESYFSGNTIQICPVGALTSEAYRFRSRPFDLVSTPSIAELDACGSAIRTDARRGKVMRRLAGDDPEVNEEWITDKDRFAFRYATAPDRLTHPQIRENGKLRPASWLEAFAVAARGLQAAGGVGVLTGGRLSNEDAYAYSKFARIALGTNDIDFRARAHSAEEADFLAQHVVGRQGVTFSDLEAAGTVVLVGFEPEDEAGAVFLRLRKAARKGTKVIAIAPFTSRGSRKMSAQVLLTQPGQEAAALSGLDLGSDAIIMVGERLAAVPGALSAAADKASASGAGLAWIPRRAGDRGALEVGALPILLPGGRPVTDAAARVDLAAAWGARSVPEQVGRDGNEIVAAAAAGLLGGLVIGGVDPADLADPSLAQQAIDKAFVVSLELRESAVTEFADVVFPVATVAEKSGSFVNWEGRVREFGQVFEKPGALPDLRVLAGIAAEMGIDLGFRTVEQAAAEMHEVGAWDDSAWTGAAAPESPAAAAEGELVLASWKQMLDDGRMQDGDNHLRETARKPVLLVSADTLAGLGVSEGDEVRLSGDLGSIDLPVQVADLAPGTVWAPASAPGASVRHRVGAAGSRVRLEGGRG
ncbi:MAG TPA: NADH-quinone oxidoreductase subunit G [Marmoricola sp.]|nr:NADH-quinone oxidoreductase subunit G [Marmoricola sp.]